MHIYALTYIITPSPPPTPQGVQSTMDAEVVPPDERVLTAEEFFAPYEQENSQQYDATGHYEERQGLEPEEQDSMVGQAMEVRRAVAPQMWLQSHRGIALRGPRGYLATAATA